MLDFWTRWTELFGNTFRQHVVDVLGYDDRVIMIIHETGEVDGVAYDNRAIYLHELRGEQWASLRTFDMDPDNCRRFWDTVPMPDPGAAAANAAPATKGVGD
jgi:hypothetical protein